MALLRVVHAGTLPDPGELLRRLQSGEPMPAVDNAAPVSDGAPTMAASPKPAVRAPETFDELVEALEARRPRLGLLVRDKARLIRYAPPEIVLQRGPVDGDFAKALVDIWDIGWTVTMEEGDGQPTLREQELAAKAAAEREILDSPVVAAIRSAFPGAELIDDERRIELTSKS